MSTERQVYDYFLGRGFAPHQAAAWAAHTMRESGGRHDVVREWDRGRESPSIAPHSFGVSQWNDTRLANLVDFARRQGREIPAGSLRDTAYVNQLGRHIPLQTQLDFAWHEMQGPERRATDAVRGARTVEDALSAAMGYYRPAGWTPSTPTMGLGYQPALATAQRLMRTAGERPAPVSATVSGLPPDPMRDESRPAFMDTAIAPRPRDESRPTIFSGIMPGYRDGGAVAADIRRAVRETNTNPTDAQKEAGNYAKGKVRILGLEIAIENPKGSTRSGTDKNGKTWRCVLPAHYGDIKRTLGSDGDAVDCYIGDTLDSDQVWVVDQIDTKSGRFDEHKCLLCFPSRTSALASYEKAFSDGRGKDRIGSVTQFSVSDFKDWLRSGDTTKPAAVAARSGTMGRVGQAAERLARFRGGRVGYADGGVPDEEVLSTMDFTPTTQRARPPSVLPLNHPDEARRTNSALGDLAHGIAPVLGAPVTGLERLAGTVVSTANELSGIPLAASAGQHMAEAQERGDPLRAAGAVGEMGLASLPIFAPMRALRPFLPSTTAGRVGLYGGTGAAAGVPIAISDAQAQTPAAGADDIQGQIVSLREQLATAEANAEAARRIREEQRPRGRRIDERDTNFNRADAEYQRHQNRVGALTRQIEELVKRDTPAYRAEAARTRAATEAAIREKEKQDADRAREEWANTPLARAYPWAPAALAAAGATIGGLGGNAITRAGVNRFNTRIDETSGLWGDAVARARSARTPRARQEALDEAESLGTQFQTRLDAGPGGHWPAVATTIAGVEGGLVAPTLIDYVTSTPGSPLRRHVTDSMSTPSEVLGRYGVGLGAGYALGEGLSHFARRRMSEPRNFRGETDALQRSTPATRLEADPALPPPSTLPALPAPGAGLPPALPPPAPGPATPALSSRVAPEAAPSVVPASEPIVIVRGTDSLGRVYHHRPAGATDADGNRVGGRRHSAPGKKPSRARRTKGPDDDITPEKDGGRVNRADGGNVLTRAVDAFRRFMGGRAPDPAPGAWELMPPGTGDQMVQEWAPDLGIALPPRQRPRVAPDQLSNGPLEREPTDLHLRYMPRGEYAGGGSTPPPLPVNQGVRVIRPPSGGGMDLNYLRGLRDFYGKSTGTVHADGGAVSARADGGPVVSGPIVGPTGGREDAKPVSVRSGSYVLPADTVAALGEGNTLKGMEVLKARFGGAITQRANGGLAQEVPILISDGEYVVTPEHVMELGRGDMAAGHKALDAFVKQTRAKQISTLKGLPGPAKS